VKNVTDRGSDRSRPLMSMKKWL